MTKSEHTSSLIKDRCLCNFFKKLKVVNAGVRKNASGKVLVLKKSYGAKLAPFQYTGASLAPEETAVQPRLSIFPSFAVLAWKKIP